MLYIIFAVAVGGFLLMWRTKKRVKTVVPPKRHGSGGQAGGSSDTEI